MDNYDIDYESECKFCKHSPIHSRNCTNLDCEDGFVDMFNDDPINYQEGECEVKCEECRGTGVEIWCPNCGKNLSGI